MNMFIGQKQLLSILLNNMKKYIFYFLLHLTFVGCNNKLNTSSSSNNNLLTQKKENNSDSLYSSELLKIGDSLLEKMPKKDIKIYVQTPHRLLKVINENWPKNIETTYNLIEEKNRPFIYIEVPYSESGDWNNTYTYYFDTSGNTRVIKIVSIFFNSVCLQDALTEETIFLYDTKFNEISKIYKLYDDEGKPVKDTSKCVFNYRFEFPLYKNYYSSPLGHK